MPNLAVERLPPLLSDDPHLQANVRQLVEKAKNFGTVKESVRAKLRTMVKRILRKYGYPPDKQEKATQTVLVSIAQIRRCVNGSLLAIRTLETEGY
jgi:hypothetical protein